MINENNIYILLGPTASGKSGIARKLLEKNDNIRLINCDSKQVYKEIPIITAQPDLEEIEKYNHKLYGYHSIHEHYNIATWLNDTSNEIKNAISQNKIPLLIGGTGMYIKALTEGISEIPPISDEIKDFVDSKIENFGREEFYIYLSNLDPKIINRINQNDIYRLTKAGQVFLQTKKSIFDFYDNKIKVLNEYNFVISVLLPDRDELYRNISIRFDDMIQNNVLTEVYKIFEDKIDKTLPSYKAHGLPELLEYFAGNIDLQDAIDQAKQNTRNYAKRQFTWFKHQISNGHFFDNKDDLENFLSEDFKKNYL